MIFKQLFDTDTYTYTYLLACETTGKAILIDSVESQVKDYIDLLDSLDLTLVYTLETHVHADHITAAGSLRTKLGSNSVVQRDAGAMCADLLVTDGVTLQVGSLVIKVLETPGHTSGCLSYLLDDRVFTGDSLLINGCGRTDFQEGDAGTLYNSITQKLFTLSPDILVYPGHDYNGYRVSSIAQEKALNSRVGGNKSPADFIHIMDNLNLPHPKHIDEALPANLACGNTQTIKQG